jgi:hypothetical protein
MQRFFTPEISFSAVRLSPQRLLRHRPLVGEPRQALTCLLRFFS